MESTGTTAFAGSNQVPEISSHDGVDSGLPKTETVSKSNCPSVAYVGAPSMEINGILSFFSLSSGSVTVTVPRVSNHGPGCSITYAEGTAAKAKTRMREPISKVMPRERRFCVGVFSRGGAGIDAASSLKRATVCAPLSVSC